MHVRRSSLRFGLGSASATLIFVVVGILPVASVARAQIGVSTDFAFIGQRGVAAKSANYSHPGSVTRLLFFEGQLVLGGNYNHAGTYATNLATWDGSTWGTFGDGTVGGGRAITTHHEKLVVGRYIWDNPGWRYLLGTTHTQIWLEHNQGGMPGIAGNWGLAGAGMALPDQGPIPLHVMRWSGFEWIELGTYSAPPYDTDTVQAMTELDGDLIVGGRLREIEGVPVSAVARWDGVTWSPMGTAIDHSVHQFETFGSDLYAAAFDGLFRWNGSDWDVVAGTEGRWVQSLAIHDNELIAGGSFETIGSANSRNIAAWNGFAWRSLADLGLQYQDVLALASDGATLYAGGAFTDTEGLPISGIARWTGSSWENLGGPGLGLTVPSGGTIRGFVLFEGGLVAAGSILGWGSVPLNGVGLLETDRWSPFGEGFDDEITSAVVYGNELHVGGYFLNSGSTSTPKVARWDGSSWHALADTIDRKVEAMIVHDGHLVIGGNFEQIDGIPYDHLAQWDGSSWSDFGGGRPGKVFAFTQFNGDLVAATDLGGARYVERWDGASWSSLGGLFDADVTAFAVHDGRLFAAGKFSWNATTWLKHVAEWDGSSWQPMDIGTNDVVHALASHGDRLYVAGEFTKAGGQDMSRLAAWSTADGQWVNLELELNWHGTALHSAPEGLYIGGDFVQVITPSEIVESLHVAFLDIPAAVTAPETPLAHRTAIESVFPNPTNPSTTIMYRVERAGVVELAIHDARGRLVRVVDAGFVTAGAHSAVWHGDDHDGRAVASGVYYVRLRADGSLFGRKVVVAR